MMSIGDFETTNLSWRWQQWQQQAGEWIELKLSQLFSNSWLTEPTANFLSWDFDWLIPSVGIVLLFSIAWLLGRWIWKFWNRGILRTPGTPSPLKEKQQLNVKNWLARSRQQQEKGNYRAACRCLYMAMLQRLDDTQIVPHQPSLTDGEYEQLLQQQPRNRVYKVLLETHKRLYFGKRRATSDTFHRCQQAYREIEEK